MSARELNASKSTAVRRLALTRRRKSRRSPARDAASTHRRGDRKIGDDAAPGTTRREKETTGMLMPRERMIVHLIAEGYSNREIAEILGLSIKTIEGDRATVKRKLNLKSLAALVRYAIRNGLVEC